MTDALTDTLDTTADAVDAIDDDVECYKAAREARGKIGLGDRRLMEIQRERVLRLRDGRSWAEVGELLDISGSRAEAIARGR